jgi:hypothetical protein
MPRSAKVTVELTDDQAAAIEGILGTVDDDLLQGLAQAALNEYALAFGGERVPAGVQDLRELRLMLLAKNLPGGLPSEREVATRMTGDIGPLLSSVSLMLAAFGFFYTTQRDRIDEVIDDGDVPDAGSTARTAKRTRAKRARTSAMILGLTALLIWVLLLHDIWHHLKTAIEQHFDLDRYSTPDVIFFVAANAWLAVAIFIATRWSKLNARVEALKE